MKETGEYVLYAEVQKNCALTIYYLYQEEDLQRWKTYKSFVKNAT